MDIGENMALSYGFFNSLDGDRLYDAEEFSSFLDGIVYDGVYQAVGNKFYVEAYNGMKVTVDTGRAWFNHTWTLNTSKLMVEIEAADTVYDRIDAVVIEVNKNDRKNYIKAIKGSPTETPSRPLLIKSDTISQYALAYITVRQNTEGINQNDIEYVVDTSETPLCSALALAGIPSGGTIGQILAKKSSESGVVGWYDIDKLPFESWYLADGILESNVLGAYKLARTLDETTVLTSVSDNKSYNLAKVNNPSWNNSNGFIITPGTGLNNSALRNLAPLSVVVYVNNVQHANNRSPLTITGCPNGSYSRCLMLEVAYSNSAGYWITNGLIGAYMRTNENRNSSEWLKCKDASCPDTAVIGVTWDSDSSCSIYLNGLVLGSTGIPGNIDTSVASSVQSENSMLVGSTATAMGQAGGGTAGGSYNISHAAFYNTRLTAAQHYEIARYMISDRAS